MSLECGLHSKNSRNDLNLNEIGDKEICIVSLVSKEYSYAMAIISNGCQEGSQSGRRDQHQTL